MSENIVIADGSKFVRLAKLSEEQLEQYAGIWKGCDKTGCKRQAQIFNALGEYCCDHWQEKTEPC